MPYAEGNWQYYLILAVTSWGSNLVTLNVGAGVVTAEFLLDPGLSWKRTRRFPAEHGSKIVEKYERELKALLRKGSKERSTASL